MSTLWRCLSFELLQNSQRTLWKRLWRFPIKSRNRSYVERYSSIHTTIHIRAIRFADCRLVELQPVARVAFLSALVRVCVHGEAFPTRLAERRAIPQCRNHPLLSGTTGRQQPPAVVSVGAYSCLVQDRLHTSPSRYVALLVSMF